MIKINFAKRIRHRFKLLQERHRLTKNLKYLRRRSEAVAPRSVKIIDCGFNKGQVAAELLSAIPGASLVGFEVQQDIRHYAYELAQKFPDREIDVIYKALADKDGEINYFEPGSWGKNHKGGTTVINGKKSQGVNYSIPKKAEAINFSKWLLTNINDGDFVFVKMDIEGGEYPVIESLIHTGAINVIDVLAVEWHAKKFPEPQRSAFIQIEKQLEQCARDSDLELLEWY